MPAAPVTVTAQAVPSTNIPRAIIAPRHNFPEAIIVLRSSARQTVSLRTYHTINGQPW